jgi:hypothetical protein
LLGLTGALLALTCSACAKDTRKPVFPAQGKVLLDGKPLPRAFLVFHPLNDSDPHAIRPLAHAEDDGTFTVSTYDAEDGAPAGEYAVTVEWRRQATKDDDAPPPNLLPDRYARPTTSALRVKIVEGENDLPPLELKKR